MAEEAAIGPAAPANDDADDAYPEAEDVIGPYPGGDDDGGYPEDEEYDEAPIGPYPGGDDDGGGYPEVDEDEAPIGPYPGGDDGGGYPEVEEEEEAPIGPYPSDAVGPYPPPPDPEPEPAPPPPPPQPPPPAAQQRWRPPDWSKPPVMHQPKVEAFENNRMARSMSLRGQRSFIIGRNGAQAEIVVADGSVSRQHAVIINSSTATFIQDLDSAHGTYYDEGGRTMHVPQLGKRLEPMGEPTKLVEGSTLRFGTHAGLVLRIVGLEQQKVTKWQPPAWVSPPERSCHLEVRSNHVANPYLEHLAGGDIDERISLRGPSTSVGRSAAHVDIVIADESISRQHAAIVHDTERQTFLIDLGSAGGSYVDGERCPPERPVTLKDGSELSFGVAPATYTFRVAKEPEPQQPGKGGKRKR